MPTENAFFSGLLGAPASSAVRGAGLGLAIVQAIAEAHGGEITLNDTDAPGTCFALVLPLEPPQETLPPLD